MTATRGIANAILCCPEVSRVRAMTCAFAPPGRYRSLFCSLVYSSLPEINFEPSPAESNHPSSPRATNASHPQSTDLRPTSTPIVAYTSHDGVGLSDV